MTCMRKVPSSNLLTRIKICSGHSLANSKTELCINYQLDAQIIIYSYNITFLYMFRATNAHLQEVTLYTCSIRYRHSLRAVVVADRYGSATTTTLTELWYHMLHVCSVTT